jgi:hypothetical protein
MTWTIVAEPVEGKDGRKNVSGLAFYLAGPTGRHAISQVARVRRNSAHPDTPFADQVDEEVAACRKIIDTINEFVAEREGPQ